MKKSIVVKFIAALALTALVVFAVITFIVNKQSSFNDKLLRIPGIIEAEDYDSGRDGISYHDTTPGNEDKQYREDGVDIDAQNDSTYYVSHLDRDEWLEYTVDVKAGNYFIEVSVRSERSGGHFHIEMDNKNISGPVRFMRTGKDSHWVTLTIGPVALQAGKRVMKFYSHSKGFGLDRFRFTGTDRPASQKLLPAVTATAPVLSTVPRLHVDGKWIMDDRGNRVVLRGVCLTDLKGISEQSLSVGKTVYELIDMLSDRSDGWHAAVVRLTVHPKWFATDADGKNLKWKDLDQEEYFEKYIDPVIQYIIRKKLYAIIDWHHINVDCDDRDIQEDTAAFWEFMAPRYANCANVLYEVLNEPGRPALWHEFLPIVQGWVDIIRTHAPDNLVLVAGPDWARVLPMPRPSNPEELLNPVKAENIVYTCHLYPGVAMNQDAKLWQQLFGNTADVAPVMLTEWGFESGAPAPTSGTATSWGNAFKTFVNSKENVGWTAWVFDNDWRPVMFDKNWKLLGGDKYMGEFTRQWLYEKKDHFSPKIVK